VASLSLLQSHNLLLSVGVTALDLPSLKELNLECNRLGASNAVEVLLQCAAFCTSLQSLLVGANSFGESELRLSLSESGLNIDAFLARGVLSHLSYTYKSAQSASQRTRLERGRFGCLVVKNVVDAAAEKDRSMRLSRAVDGNCSSLLVPERLDFHFQFYLLQMQMKMQMIVALKSDQLSDKLQPSLDATLVTKLNLSGGNLRPSSFEDLANVLQRLPALLELNLSLNHFPDDGLFVILQEVQSLLTTLIICNVGLTAAGLLAARSFAGFKFVSLAHIDISNNTELQASGFAALLKSVPVHNLLHLFAPNCGIDLCKRDGAGSDDQLQRVLYIFRQASLLQTVDLSNNALGDSAVEGILRAMSPDPENYGCSNAARRSVNVAVNRPQQSLSGWVSPLKNLNLSCTACDQGRSSLSHHFDKWFNSILIHLTKLTHLRMSHNQCLINLNPSVSYLRRLEFLDLSHCKNLLTIPDELILGSLGRSFGLSLLGCDALEHPPLKVVAKGLEAIREFVDVEDSEKKPLKNVKVVMLGNGGSGKRNLLCALAGIGDSEYKSFDETNQLIRRQYMARKGWLAKTMDNSPTLSFWNFGGQLEYSSHLNFYMAARQCVYVTVFSVVERHEVLVQQISYWLRTVFGRVGSQQSARIFLIANHIDALHPSLVDKYKNNIRDLISRLLVAMGVSLLVGKQIHLDYWFAADPRFPGHREEIERITDNIFDYSASMFDESGILRLPASYLPMLREVKRLAQRCNDSKTLPLIKLADLTKAGGFDVLAGSDRNLRKLDAIKLLSEVGVLISYTDLQEQPWICVNLNFCVDVATLFSDYLLNTQSSSQVAHQPVMSKTDLYHIFQHVFETAVASVSWYSSSLSQGYPESLFGFFVAQGLLLPVPALRFKQQFGASNESVFVIPLLLKGRPDSWRDVFGHSLHDASAAHAWGFAKPVRIKGSRFASHSIEFMITIPIFFKLMLSRCCDSRFMWGASFVYHVDGTSIFVRLAEDRHGVDVVTIGPDAQISEAVEREIECIALELGLSERHQLLLLCPLCCTSDRYVKFGTVRVFFEQQIDHYREYGRNAICHHNHVLEVSCVEQGAIFHMPAAPDPEGPFFPDVCREKGYV